jgi:hypothetical protein
MTAIGVLDFLTGVTSPIMLIDTEKGEVKAQACDKAGSSVIATVEDPRDAYDSAPTA